MLALSLVASLYAPPPPPPPGTPPTTIADLVRIEGTCSLSVIISGDDALSMRFNSAVISATDKAEKKFCRRATGNYVIHTNSNVQPTNRTFDYFQFHLTAHDARDFITNYNSAGFATLAIEKRECRTAPVVCAKRAVKKILKKLEAR